MKGGKKNEDSVPSVRAVSKFKESRTSNIQIIYDYGRNDCYKGIKSDNVILFPLMTTAHVQAAVELMCAHNLKSSTCRIPCCGLRRRVDLV